MLIKDYGKSYLYDTLKQAAATYAHGIGPASGIIFQPDVMALARSLELKVHPWYIRDDFLTVGSDAYEENRKFYEVGLDGVFTEYPHTTYQLFLEWSK